MIKNKQFKAFTLVELLVSVAILLLVLGAAVSVEVQSIKLASTNEHSLQAANLAQEQLNLVKTVRDNNIKDYTGPTPEPFKNFPTTPTGTPAATDIKNLTAPLAGKWGLADGSTTKVIDGVTYTIEIKAWDVPNL